MEEIVQEVDVNHWQQIWSPEGLFLSIDPRADIVSQSMPPNAPVMSTTNKLSVFELINNNY